MPFDPLEWCLDAIQHYLEVTPRWVQWVTLPLWYPLYWMVWAAWWIQQEVERW